MTAEDIDRIVAEAFAAVFKRNNPNKDTQK